MAKNIPFDKEIKREPSVYSGEKFEYCNWLKEVIVSPRVKTIKENAFYGCKSLEKVTIPEGVKKIEDWAFYGCVNLKELSLPESLEKIGFDAFGECNIECLYISKNLKEIVYDSLGCTNLKRIDVNPESPYYYLHQGVLIDKRENLVVECPKYNEFTKIEFPESISRFRTHVFRDCKTLQTITIRNGQNALYSFENCENLEEVNIPDTTTAITREAFYNCKKLSRFTLPSKVSYIEEHAFHNCKSLESIFIPASLSGIQASTFVGCDSLTKIEIDPANTNIYKKDGILISKKYNMSYHIPGINCAYVHSAGPYSDAIIGFERNITDVVVPENVTTIGDHVFSESKITSVTLSDSVELIAMYAFRNCHDLKSITIGDGLKEICSEAFFGCENLKEINVSPNNQNFIFEDGMLLSKDKTTLFFVVPQKEIVVPETIKCIISGAFSSCKSEDIKITFPEKFKCTPDIFSGTENCTFVISDVAKELRLQDDCKNLTIEVRHVGKSKNLLNRDYRFKNAKKVVLPNSIKNISGYIFSKNVQEFIIPESVEIIDNYAFDNASLPNLVIPDSVIKIGEGALRGVKNVEVSNVCDIQDVYIDLDAPISFEGAKGKIYTEKSTGNIVLHGVDSDASRQRYEMHKYWFGEVKPGLQKSGLDFFYWDASNNTFGARINDEIDAILNTTTMPNSDDVIGFVSTLANNINNATLGFKIVDEIVSEKEVIETKSKPKVKNGLFVMAVSDEEQKENAKKEREASMNDLFFKGVLYDYLEQNPDVKVSVCKVDENGAKLGVDYHGCFLFTLTIPASVIDDGTSGDAIQNLLEEMDKYNVRCMLV